MTTPRAGGRHSEVGVAVGAVDEAMPLDAPPLRRQLVVYGVGLLVPYVAAVVAFWPSPGEQPNQAVFFAVMFAPTIGALAATWFAGGRIRWGRLNWWLLAGLVPTLAALGAYLLASGVGWASLDASLLGKALVAAPVAIGSACVSAVGEEIGWRGFLWPTLRDSWTFGRTVLVVFVVWWLYHVPLILLGWYGSMRGLPAFTVAVVGISLFMGVVTDRSGSMWPSVVAHGAWNGLVATSFAVTRGAERVPAFAGNESLLGEFGWLAAGSVLVVGLLVAVWHVRIGAPRRTSRAAGRHT